MCGIIGIVGNQPVADRLVDGLRRMEYRGYDSAGICTLHDGKLIRRRAEGKLANLVTELAEKIPLRAKSVLPTRAGPHMVRPRPRTPTLMRLIMSRWYTMVSSRISRNCGPN